MYVWGKLDSGEVRPLMNKLLENSKRVRNPNRLNYMGFERGSAVYKALLTPITDVECMKIACYTYVKIKRNNA